MIPYRYSEGESFAADIFTMIINTFGWKTFVELQVLGQGLVVDFTFAWDNNNNNNNNNKNDKNPHLNFLKGTVLGDKEQGVGIRDKG